MAIHCRAVKNSFRGTAHIESRFRAKGVMEEWDRLDYCCSKEIIQLRFNEVANPDDDEPYSHLKDTLVQHHTLTKYQWIERLLAMGLLGSCHPTQLLAEIIELCPDDEEASCFFAFFFLHRLTSWLRVQLEGDDQDDIRRLATRVDACSPCMATSTVGLSPKLRTRRTWTSALPSMQ